MTRRAGGKRGNWTTNALQQAVKDDKNKVRTQREAASHFNIPRRIIRNYLNENAPVQKLGRNKIFTAQEQDMAERLVRSILLDFYSSR